MNLRSSFSLAVLVVVVALVSTGSSLQCHQCSTFTHTMCGDPFFNEDNGVKTPKTNDFLKECPADGNDYTMCRKTYQNVRGDERIIRSCAFEEYRDQKDVCYKTVLEEYNTYVCTCEGDGCNGSSTVGISMFSVLLATLLAAVFK